MSRETPAAPRNRVRQPTATARFGSSRRESHDASDFYARFVTPRISTDDTVAHPGEVDVIHGGDARDMSAVESNSVALVVTSPPYFAGKEYETSLGRDGVPGSYLEYLTLLSDVFTECRRVLEPGGRMAVNVANLGRRPYRSLSGDVTTILGDLGLLLRGEVVWWKGRAAGGSCAWGTFQRPGNPVLRDVTERVVIGAKGRFDRALTPEQRAGRGLPSTATISRDEFLESTTDLWEIPAESATRVGHPAPFPVALPRRLIELYTYEGDVVLDPFMGSGSTGVAAVQSGRCYIGYETDPAYANRARQRILDEQAAAPAPGAVRVQLPAPGTQPDDAGAAGDSDPGLLNRATRRGVLARELAGVLLDSCGFSDIRSDVRVPKLGVELAFVARDRTGRDWAFDVSGTMTSSGPSGLRRSDTLWRALGRAAALHQAAWGRDIPLVLLTTDRPARGSSGSAALTGLLGPGRPIRDVIELLDPDDQARLRWLAERGPDPS